VTDEPLAGPSRELLAADRATRAAASAADRWIDHYRRVASETVSEVQLDTLLKEALAAIARLLRADAASLLLANEEGTALISRAAYGLAREVDLSVSIPSGAGVSGPVLATAEPRFIDDLRTVELVSDVLLRSDQRSYVGVPLVAADRVLGVLHVTRKRVAPFGGDDAEMLWHFAGPLASAIDRVRLFQAERAARREAEEATAIAHRNAERLRGLQDVTAALAGAATVDEICQIIIHQAVPGADELGARAIWIHRNGRLVLEAGVGESRFYPEIGLDDPLPAAAALRTGRPIFAESHAEIAQGWPPLEAGPTTAFAALPLVMGGRPFGLLSIGLRTDHRFEAEERQYLIAIAEQAAVALARAESQAALEDAWRVADERREQLDFLAEAGDRFGRSLDLDVTLSAVASLGVPRVADRCAVYLVDPGEPTRMEKRLLSTEVSREEWDLFERSGSTLSTLGAVGTVIESGRTLRIDELSDAVIDGAAIPADERTALKEVGFGGVAIVPLRARGRVIGALSFVNQRGRRMDDATVALAEELAGRAAVAIDNAQLYGHQSHVARQLVESLLPSRLPEVSGLDLAVHYRPGSQGLEVGGDFYDVIVLHQDSCLAVIGDVQGKGVEAAAVTGFARTTVKTAARFEADPAAILRHLNEALLEQMVDRATDPDHPWDEGRMCTAVVVRLDRQGPGVWQLSASSAGHPLPLVRRADGSVEQVGSPALMLGVLADPPYADATAELRPGEALVLFTDGATDCDPGTGRLGAEGVERLLRASSGGAAETTATVAAGALAGVGRHDDVVILTITVLPAR
jgi:GAF domain-containing protein